jgi:FKBP-type peptidyl-prolyl cis-trans isomerase SlyD
MEITTHSVVALTWTLKDTLGEVLDELVDPVEFFVGGDDLLAKVQAQLMGYSAGDTLDLHLEPEDAFGDYDEMLVFLEKRSLFPKELEEGMTIEGHALPSGCNPDAGKDLFYTVTEIYPEHVVLDANHPLAGIALRVHLKIHHVRAASEDELKAGSMGTGFFKVIPQADGGSLLH